MNPEVRARLLLSHVIEAGDPRLRTFLESSSPEKLWHKITRADRVPEPWHLASHTAETRAILSLQRASGAGLRWITPGDAEWPPQLADLDGFDGINSVSGAPLGLWVAGAGDLNELTRESVAIVGARNCTTYGAEMGTEMAADCADSGFTVISGAAFGIDACAHRGALALGHPTIAVMACGADVDYPRAHASLLARILETGVVVSEFPPGEPPQRHRFLTRNRLIAALSNGVVVIEAAQRSGSLNTLHWADQLGRTTMGLPGPVTSQASNGVHAAIREGKAILVTRGEDVRQELAGLNVLEQ